MSSICDGDTIRQPFDLAAACLAPAYFACGNAGMSHHGCAAIELWIDGNEASMAKEERWESVAQQAEANSIGAGVPGSS